MKLTREQRLLKLNSISNLRDLGGYEAKDGRYTRSHKYLRSAVMSTISDEDLEYIYNYGVRVVVDLRSELELQQEPNKMNGYKDVEYIHINLMNQSDINVVPKGIRDMGDMYIAMARDNKEQYKELFNIFHKHLDQTIVFHCSAGKDRTGTTAALLLDIAGCSKEDIITDYAETFENNKAIYEKLQGLIPEEVRHMLLSEPEYMERYLNYIYTHYGNGYGYLKDIGLSDEVINDLINNFISDKDL